MNIFYLSHNTKQCAAMHVNKHAVKMILEYAQILSTTHRYLDGHQSIITTATGRKKKAWVLEDSRDSILYSATHINHPSTVWARQSIENYRWLYQLFVDLLQEYTHRYGKTHLTSKLIEPLRNPPTNIPTDKPFTEPTPAMPDQYKVIGNSVQSYKNYYLGSKSEMFQWKNRPVPDFVLQAQL